MTTTAGGIRFPANWQRPSQSVLDPQTNTMRLRHVETSSFGTRVSLFCISEQGPSVQVDVINFKPYFYCERPPGGDMANPLLFQEWLTTQLNTEVENEVKKNPRMGWKQAKDGKSVLGVEAQRYKEWKADERQLLSPEVDVWKVTVAAPHFVCMADTILHPPPPKKGEKRGIEEQKPQISLKTYEVDVDYELRAMVDSHLHGSQWFDLHCHPQMAIIKPGKGSCNWHVVQARLEDITPIPTTEKNDTGPTRMLSFDIECLADPNADSTFPVAVPKSGHPDDNGGPVVTIGATLEEDGRIINHVCFQLLDTTDFDPETEQLGGVPITLYTFEEEEELIKAFAAYVRWCDPDSFTGYNIDKFDIPYLIDRSVYLGLRKQEYNWSRLHNYQTKYRHKVTKTRAYGTKEAYDLVAPGRESFDMMRFIQKEYKLRSYGLNAVAEHFLKDKKEDVPHYMIPILQRGTPEDRHLLAKYCVKDAYLPLVLYNKLKAGIRYTEQARVTGVPRSWLLARGQGIRSFSCCLRFGRELGFIVNSHGWRKTDFQGATVLDPMKGFHKAFVAILDFASLYPSIMQAYNICFTTIRNRAWALRNLREDDYNDPHDILSETVLQRNYVFVKPHIQPGILPAIETRLLAARRAAKRRMNDYAYGTDMYNIFDSTQLALKIVCNSLYGYLNGFIMYDTRLAQAVTAWGRAMIVQTQELILERYPFATIVYGDTDSVFVDFGKDNLRETGILGDEAARYVTERLKDPNELEIEAIYTPLLIPSGKKRYAFGKYEPNLKKPIAEHTEEDWKFIGYKSKGMENVRRDSAPITSDTVDQAMKILLKTKNVDEAAQYVRDVCADLRQNRVPYHKLIMSKSFSKSIKEYEAKGTRPIHIELVKRMRKRDADTAPRVGSRVQFIMVGDAARLRRFKSYEMSEDPMYAMQNRITPNAEYYIQNQLKKPLIRLFLPVFEPNLDWKSIKTSDRKIEKTKTYQLLFLEGGFTSNKRLKRKQVRSTSIGLGQWAVVLPKCNSCNAKLPPGSTIGSYCEHCQGSGEAAKTQRHLTIEYEDTKEQNRLIWKGCVDCQSGDERMARICQNTHCDQLYRRMQSDFDLEDLAKKLQINE